MANLYTLAQEFRQLLDDIDSGVIPEEAIGDTLESVECALDDKLENVAVFIKELKSDVDALAAEEKALRDRRESKQRKLERMTDYLTAQMQLTGKKKLERPRASISIRRSEAVEISDEAEFLRWATGHRDDLLTYKAPAISKSAIKLAISDGEKIPFASIVERGKAAVK